MAKATTLLCMLKQLYTNNSLSCDFLSFFFQSDTDCDKICFKNQMVKQDVQSAYYYSFYPKL